MMTHPELLHGFLQFESREEHVFRAQLRSFVFQLGQEHVTQVDGLLLMVQIILLNLRPATRVNQTKSQLELEAKEN